MSEYKRFTKKDKYGHWYTETKINDRFMWSKDGKVWERDLSHYAFDGESIDRLAELEDKIENGTLIELPCKAGDKVYQFDNGGEIYESEIKGLIYDCRNFAFDEMAIGKSVFLTKAEAQARLKELKEKQK